MKELLAKFSESSPSQKIEIFRSANEGEKSALFPEVQKIIELSPKLKKRFLSLLYNEDNPTIQTVNNSIYQLILEVDSVTGSWPESFLDLDKYPVFQVDSEDETFYITENAEDFLNSLTQYAFFDTKDVFSDTPPSGIETDAGYREIKEEKLDEFDFFAETVSQAKTLSDLYKFYDPENGLLHLYDPGLLFRTKNVDGKNIVDLINDKALEIIQDISSKTSTDDVKKFPFYELTHDGFEEVESLKVEALSMLIDEMPISEGKTPVNELLKRKQAIVGERAKADLSTQEKRLLRRELAIINRKLRQSKEGKVIA